MKHYRFTRNLLFARSKIKNCVMKVQKSKIASLRIMLMKFELDMRILFNCAIERVFSTF